QGGSGFEVVAGDRGDGLGVDGARLHDPSSGADPLEDPTGAGVGLHEGGVVGQAAHHNVGGGAGFGRAVGDLAPDVAGNGGRFFGRPVPHHGAEPGAGDAAGHGGPHAPRSDHADGADFVGHV